MVALAYLVICGLGPLILFSGCAATRSPFAAPPTPALEAYAAHLQQTLAESSGPVTRIADRNAILDGYTYLADISYREYEASLYAQRAALETVADLAVLGMSAGSALASGQAVSAGLAAAASATTGAKGVVSADFYEQQAKGPVVFAMREIRARKRTEIEECKRKYVRDCSLSAGMVLVGDYASVNVLSAIEVLTQQSIKALDAQKVELENAQRGAVPDDQ